MDRTLRERGLYGPACAVASRVDQTWQIPKNKKTITLPQGGTFPNVYLSRVNAPLQRVGAPWDSPRAESLPCKSRTGGPARQPNEHIYAGVEPIEALPRSACAGAAEPKRMWPLGPRAENPTRGTSRHNLRTKTIPHSQSRGRDADGRQTQTLPAIVVESRKAEKGAYVGYSIWRNCPMTEGGEPETRWTAGCFPDRSWPSPTCWRFAVCSTGRGIALAMTRSPRRNCDRR